MKILGIETSCDETAVCLIDCDGSVRTNDLRIRILGNALHSQIESHKQFGGVVPMNAKREHAKNLIPLFLEIISFVSASNDASMKQKIKDKLHKGVSVIEEIFGREVEFKDEFIKMATSIGAISIDAIAVTEGPGLEPALWMGIIFAEALSFVFDIPIVPVNHMEGHIFSALPSFPSEALTSATEIKEKDVTFPIISLLISGGHTELILMENWHSYKILGQTRDDAVGEAFDKVARMLGLPYPGGPEISRLAESERARIRNDGATKTSTPKYILPRPMIASNDFDFSFSGLKTAVLYSLKNGIQAKETVAKEFEDAVTDVLISKTLRSMEKYNARTLIIGGGVVSNSFIRKTFEEGLKKMLDVTLLIPDPRLRTDNALMIAIAGYEKMSAGFEEHKLRANGTMRLG